MMDEKFFEPSPSSGGVKSFDAFPKTRRTYVQQTPRGGLVTVLITLASLYLFYHEFNLYLVGKTHQHFEVEGSISTRMDINIDISVAMPCQFLDVNVQDAAGDRILAADVLQHQDVYFEKQLRGHHKFQDQKEEFDEELWDMVGKSHEGKFKRRSTRNADGCRIFGTMKVNRVQGDFHITAKGHGYWSEGQHLEHGKFNFSHAIDELSFGTYYPRLINPLDDTKAITDKHFYRYQYYLSVIPTTYRSYSQGFAMFTNQYAVNTQQRELGQFGVPGLFFKFEIEPISVTVEDKHASFIGFIIRLVNVLSGVAVAGGWIYAVWDNMIGAIRRTRARASSNGGMLSGGFYKSAA